MQVNGYEIKLYEHPDNRHEGALGVYVDAGHTETYIGFVQPFEDGGWTAETEQGWVAFEDTKQLAVEAVVTAWEEER